MSLSSFVNDNTLLLGFIMVGGFFAWKFIIEPAMNAGEPIEPTEESIKTFGEKMQENLKTEVDF